MNNAPIRFSDPVCALVEGKKIRRGRIVTFSDQTKAFHRDVRTNLQVTVRGMRCWLLEADMMDALRQDGVTALHYHLKSAHSPAYPEAVFEMFQMIGLAEFCRHGAVEMGGRLQMFCPVDEWRWAQVTYDAPESRDKVPVPKRDVGEEARRKIREVLAS